VGFRFQKRIGIVPGVGVNLSRSGASVSIGERGAHLTLGRTPRVTVGLPGSGLSYTTTMSRGRGQAPRGAVAFIVRGATLLIGAAIGLGILAMIAHG
jgi:hypothetical protein